MRRRSLLTLAALVGFWPGSSAAQTPVWVVSGVWAEPSLVGAPNGVAYFTIVNKTGTADRLVKASTPVAERAEVHVDEMNSKGVMTMRSAGALDIADGGRIRLSQYGGLHLMLIGLKHPLKSGDRFPLTLSFEHGRPLTLEVPVQPNPPPGAEGR